MIKEYRKKTTIKAEQFDGSDEMANKYNMLWELDLREDMLIPYLPTREGKMFIKKGDWIATGIDGEHWAIADDIFCRTYEEVKGEQTTQEVKTFLSQEESASDEATRRGTR